jgi:MFS transporter, DHA1 family, inner membrane transport protein
LGFFANRSVNLLTLHYVLHHAAIAGGGAFWVVHLVKSGVTLPAALTSVALVLLGRFLIRPLLVPLGVAYGLRPLLIVGTIASSLQYLILAEVQGVGLALFMLIIVTAIGDTIYWTCYHAYFAAVGDDDARGRQIGLREASVALVGVVSPLIGGWLLATAGPRTAFAVAGLISALSAWPLLRAPDVAIARGINGITPIAKRSIVLFAADGWIAACILVLWPVLLFQVLGENFIAFGAALAIASLIAAGLGPILGRIVDTGGGIAAAYAGAAAVTIVILARAAAIDDAGYAVAANASGALLGALYLPAFMTAVYTSAKRSPCPLRFHVATEGGWDAGGALGLLVIAGMLGVGVAPRVCMLLALLGVALHVAALLPYYRRGTT